jgi:hypothetical protein
MCCCICGRCTGWRSGHLTRSRPRKLTNQSHAAKFGLCFPLFDQVLNSRVYFIMYTYFSIALLHNSLIWASISLLILTVNQHFCYVCAVLFANYECISSKNATFPKNLQKVKKVICFQIQYLSISV